MKTLTLLLAGLFYLPSVALAQNSQLQKLKEMGECMNKIDPKQMDALADQGKKMMADATVLCNAGKRDEAKALQDKFTTEETNTPISQAIKNCSNIIKSEKIEENSITKMHICDRVKMISDAQHK
ncbi:hypothetical protein [Methylomonas sp. AM2-LC]|uniref:hypothetical protein n=1 Tax=Methylomonas sp. AM2-LC TaxID=3153301 RepID=UPI0032634E60